MRVTLIVSFLATYPYVTFAELLPEHNELMDKFAIAREECVISEFVGPDCEKAEKIAADLDAVGVCFAAEQNPYYCSGAPSASTVEGSQSELAGWHHFAAPMGQFEGTYQNRGASSQIVYACSGLSSTVAFVTKGIKVKSGLGRLYIDNQLILEAAAVYSSATDETSMESRVTADAGEKQKQQHNAVIAAIAKGKEAIWEVPTGEKLSFSLHGSSKIRACLVY